MGFWDALASVGPYANNLHLSPDMISTPAHHQSIFIGRMHFLMPNQQCQSTEGNYKREQFQYFSSHPPDNQSLIRCCLLEKGTKTKPASKQRTGTNLARASTLSSSSIVGRVAGFLIIGLPSSVVPATKPPAVTSWCNQPVQ